MGMSETVPAMTRAGTSALSGDISGAGKALVTAGTFGAVGAPGAAKKPDVLGVDPAILALKARQEAQTAAEEEQRKRRGSVLSEFARGPASIVSGGGKSVLGSNLFG